MQGLTDDDGSRNADSPPQQAWANWLISCLSISSVCELRTASSARIFPYQDSADQLVLALGRAVLKNVQSLLVCG